MRGTVAAVTALLVLAYPVWSIMLRPDLDLWRTDDGEPHLLRMYAMRLAFRENVALPRWIPDLYRGYGYPVFNFYAPLSYVAGHVLTLAGLSVWNAFRLLGIGAIALGAAGVYALVRVSSSRVTGTHDRVPAIIAGLLYVIAPYPFITNLYVRADLPEALGLAIMPWFVLAVDRCLIDDDRRTAFWPALVAATVGATILLVHQLSAVIGFACAVLWTLARVGTMPASTMRQGFLRLAVGGVVAAGLVAFSAVPTLTEGASVHLALVQMRVGDMVEKLSVPFGTVARPLISHPTADPGEPGAIDWAWAYRYPWGVQSTFGPVKPAGAHAVTAIVVTLGIVAVAITRRRSNLAVPMFGPLLVLGTAWAFNTTWTEAIWASFVPLQFMQFPSRLYGPFSLGVAVGAGYLLDHASATSIMRRHSGWIAGTVSVGAIAYASLASAPIYLSANVSQAVDLNTFLRTEYGRDLWNGGAVTGNAEFTPAGVDIAVTQPGTPSGNQVFDREFPPGAWVGSTALIHAGTARIIELRRTGLRFDVTVEVQSPGATVALHQLWFPGWRAYVDGTKVPIRMPPYDATTDARLGFQLIDIPTGTHVVTTMFGSTPPRLAGDAITAITTVAIAGVLLRLVITRWRSIGLIARARWVAATFASVAVAYGVAAQLSTEALMSLPPRRVSAATPNLVVAELIDLARTGRARILSPTGPDFGRDKFVDIGWQLIGPMVASRPGFVEFPHGGRMRQWLYMHPPSRATFAVDVSVKETFFTAGMALRPEAWYTDYGDGVRFAVDIATAGTRPVEIYGQRLNPRANADERRWVEVRLPLAAYLGQSIEITLRTDPVDDVRNDWAGWGNPMVVVDRTLLRPENGPDVPANVGPRPKF